MVMNQLNSGSGDVKSMRETFPCFPSKQTLRPPDCLSSVLIISHLLSWNFLKFYHILPSSWFSLCNQRFAVESANFLQAAMENGAAGPGCSRLPGTALWT